MMGIFHFFFYIFTSIDLLIEIIVGRLIDNDNYHVLQAFT